MVCVPCIAIPILLLLWRFFIQPLVLIFWNKQKIKGNNNQHEKEASELVKECKNGVCTLAWKNDSKVTKTE